MPKELDGWVDADFAGDLVSRRSSSGLVILFSEHCLKTSSSVQEQIGLSSGESEFYACVKGGAALLGNAVNNAGLGSLPQVDFENSNGTPVQPKGFATRRGLGRQRHVSTRFLWLQAKSKQGRFEGGESWHDFLTKLVTARWPAEKSPEFGLEFRGGRSSMQRGLVS